MKYILYFFPVFIVFPLTLDLGAFSVSSFDLIVLGLFVVYLTSYPNRFRFGNTVISPFNQLQSYFLLFIISCFISIILSPYQAEPSAFIQILRHIESLLFMLFLPFFYRKYDFNANIILKSHIVAGVVAGFLGISQFTLSFGIDVKDRIGGIKHGPGFAGIMMTALIIVYFYSKWSNKLTTRSMLTFVVLGASMVLANTRTWVLSVLVLYFLDNLSWNKLLKPLIAFTLIGIIISNLEVNGSQNIERLKKLITPSELIENPRFIKWETSLEIFTQRPLLGVGLTNLKNANENLSITMRDEDERRKSDSEYFDLLAMNGVMGILLFFIINIILLRRHLVLMRNHYSFSRIFFFIQIGWLIGGLFWSISDHYVGSYYFLVLTNSYYVSRYPSIGH